MLPAQQTFLNALKLQMEYLQLLNVMPIFTKQETDVMHKLMQLRASSGIPFQLPVNSKHATLLAKLATETQLLIVLPAPIDQLPLLRQLNLMLIMLPI